MFENCAKQAENGLEYKQIFQIQSHDNINSGCQWFYTTQGNS